MDQEQDTGFSDWDPMKASYEQKHFNTYSKAQYDANFTEKHAAVRGWECWQYFLLMFSLGEEGKGFFNHFTPICTSFPMM